MDPFRGSPVRTSRSGGSGRRRPADVEINTLAATLTPSWRLYRVESCRSDGDRWRRERRCFERIQSQVLFERLPAPPISSTWMDLTPGSFFGDEGTVLSLGNDPANDDFANATSRRRWAPLPGSNLAATGEANRTGFVVLRLHPTNSVWWAWTPATSSIGSNQHNRKRFRYGTCGLHWLTGQPDLGDLER